MSDKLVAELEHALHDQPVNPLRPAQRQDWEEERTRLQGMVNAPNYIQADRGAAHQRYRQLTKLLEEQSPKPITGDRANEVKRLSEAVLDRVLKPQLQPAPVMRRRPPGAVDHCLKGEFSAAYKRAALAWKRARWALDPTTTDTDHSNLERYRRQDGPGFMANSEEGLPGYVSFSHIPDDKWPFPPPQTTAVAQVARREAKPRKVLTAEERQALGARLQAGRRKKREQQNGGAA